MIVCYVVVEKELLVVHFLLEMFDGAFRILTIREKPWGYFFYFRFLSAKGA